jgi:hypothetical protein
MGGRRWTIPALTAPSRSLRPSSVFSALKDKDSDWGWWFRENRTRNPFFSR